MLGGNCGGGLEGDERGRKGCGGEGNDTVRKEQETVGVVPMTLGVRLAGHASSRRTRGGAGSGGSESSTVGGATAPDAGDAAQNTATDATTGSATGGASGLLVSCRIDGERRRRVARGMRLGAFLRFAGPPNRGCSMMCPVMDPGDEIRVEDPAALLPWGMSRPCGGSSIMVSGRSRPSISRWRDLDFYPPPCPRGTHVVAECGHLHEWSAAGRTGVTRPIRPRRRRGWRALSLPGRGGGHGGRAHAVKGRHIWGQTSSAPLLT